MSWIAWDTLVKPKQEGGLGFKDITKFNDPMLAKIAWRILHNPTALLSRVLKGKYFPHGSFLHCSYATGSSHGWKSVVAGRETLKLGLGWLVGVGTEVRIWSDSWLPNTLHHRPYGPVQEHLQTMVVADLIDPVTNEWNLASIHTLLPEYEDIITMLPRSSIKRPDKIVWLHEKSGTYSTRSGYRLLTSPSAVDSLSGVDWTTLIWSLKTTPKIKNFLWKASRNALAVGQQLLNRGMEVNPNCARCGALETIPHVLFSCPFAQTTWSKAPIHGLRLDPETTIISFLERKKHMINLPPVGIGESELFPWICWRIWSARNNLVFKSRLLTEEDIMNMAIQEAKQWQDAQISSQAKLHHRPASPKPTPVATTLCHVDAAWLKETKECSCGWWYENRQTHSSAAFWSTAPNQPSPLAAEAMAIKLALVKALELQISTLCIFSDSLTLVKLLSTTSMHIEIFGILEDIRDLVKAFSSIAFTFVPHTDNVVADSLAKRGLSNYPRSALGVE